MPESGARKRKGAPTIAARTRRKNKGATAGGIGIGAVRPTGAEAIGGGWIEAGVIAGAVTEAARIDARAIAAAGRVCAGSVTAMAGG